MLSFFSFLYFQIQKTFPPKIFSYNKNIEVVINPSLPQIFKPISDSNLIKLINGIALNIELCKIFGFPTVKCILRKKLNETGMPFFSINEYLWLKDDITSQELKLETLMIYSSHVQVMDYDSIYTSSDEESDNYEISISGGDDDYDNKRIINYNNSKQTNKKEIIEKFRCKICVSQWVNVCTLTCKHMIICSQCTGKITNDSCPYCRTNIVSYIRLNSYDDEDNDDDYDYDDDDDENEDENEYENEYEYEVIDDSDEERQNKIIKRFKKKQNYTDDGNNEKKKIIEKLKKKRKKKRYHQYDISAFLCKICYSNYVDVILLPCAHMSICFICYRIKLKTCPQCEKIITNIIVPKLV